MFGQFILRDKKGQNGGYGILYYVITTQAAICHGSEVLHSYLKALMSHPLPVPKK